jgi:hypothetical protein
MDIIKINQKESTFSVIEITNVVLMALKPYE